MNSYAELAKHPKVKSVSFPGGGIGVVVLKPGFTSGGETQITAGFFQSAKRFVELAK